MKPDPDSMRRLLDEMLPIETAEFGPSRAAVVAMAGKRRVRRKRLRAVAAAALLTACGAVLWPGKDDQRVMATQNPAPRPLVEQVNDEQLLVLLKDTPAALMEWPNGDRTLLVVGH
jgi:hypothetical protein